MKFHALKIAKIVAETADSVSLYFDIKASEKPHFEYTSGQYLTLKLVINGSEERRAYSICSAPKEKYLGITVKRVVGGKVSNYLNDEVEVGDKIEVATPKGEFIHQNKDQQIFLFGAGSGITPLYSILKHKLSSNANSKVFLYYGNKYFYSVIYQKSLDKLQEKSPNRLTITYFFSKESDCSPNIKGRINKENLLKFEEKIKSNLAASSFYICGPEAMIDEVSAYLSSLTIPKEKIRSEKFFTSNIVQQSKSICNETTAVTVILDDEKIDLTLNQGQTILKALLDKGYEPPYSCNEGNCSSCVAKVLEGEVAMYKCETLDEDEIEEGYVLGCQVYTKGSTATISFDE